MCTAAQRVSLIITKKTHHSLLYIILLSGVRARSISGAKLFARETRSTFPKSPLPTKRSLASRASHSSFPARCHLAPRQDRCQFIPASSHRVAIMAQFLDAFSYLYARVCPSVGRSVGPSAGRSVGNAFFSNCKNEGFSSCMSSGRPRNIIEM